MFVTHDRDDRDIVCFVGDSYANCGSGMIHWSHNKLVPVAGHQHDIDALAYTVYTDLVADKLNMRPLVLGFGGASWWQTRYIVTKFFEQFPKEKQHVKKVIAMHTNAYRVNSIRCVNTTNGKFQESEWFDPEFHDWCQQQWFREFSHEIFDQADILNFSCFGWPVDKGHSNLRGLSFVEPLIWITVGEFTGSKLQVDRQLQQSRDIEGTKNPHHCHLNAKNHAVLTDVIVETFSKKEPSREQHLDLDRFDRHNRNGHHWPDGCYWDDQR